MVSADWPQIREAHPGYYMFPLLLNGKGAWDTFANTRVEDEFRVFPGPLRYGLTE